MNRDMDVSRSSVNLSGATSPQTTGDVPAGNLTGRKASLGAKPESKLDKLIKSVINFLKDPTGKKAKAYEEVANIFANDPYLNPDQINSPSTEHEVTVVESGNDSAPANKPATKKDSTITKMKKAMSKTFNNISSKFSDEKKLEKEMENITAYADLFSEKMEKSNPREIDNWDNMQKESLDIDNVKIDSDLAYQIMKGKKEPPKGYKLKHQTETTGKRILFFYLNKEEPSSSVDRLNHLNNLKETAGNKLNELKKNRKKIKNNFTKKTINKEKFSEEIENLDNEIEATQSKIKGIEKQIQNKTPSKPLPIREFVQPQPPPSSISSPSSKKSPSQPKVKSSSNPKKAMKTFNQESVKGSSPQERYDALIKKQNENKQEIEKLKQQKQKLSNKTDEKSISKREKIDKEIALIGLENRGIADEMTELTNQHEINV